LGLNLCLQLSEKLVQTEVEAAKQELFVRFFCRVCGESSKVKSSGATKRSIGCLHGSVKFFRRHAKALSMAKHLSVIYPYFLSLFNRQFDGESLKKKSQSVAFLRPKGVKSTAAGSGQRLRPYSRTVAEQFFSSVESLRWVLC